MITRQEVLDAIDVAFIKAERIDELSHREMFRLYEAAVNRAFDLAAPWEAFHDETRAFRRKWIVRNKFTGAPHTKTGKKCRLTITYETEASARATAKRLNGD